MIQATQKALATEQLLLTGTQQGEDFTAFLQTYPLPDTIPPNAPVFMLLESQPHRVIEYDERQGLLHFALFDSTFDFTPYTSGRIFHALGELRWERQHTNIHIIYTGHKDYKPELRHAKEIRLDTCFFTDRAYFLFGKRLDEKQRDRIGPAAQPGDFAEVRIPRLLRYPSLPTLTGAERVRLVVCEYIHPVTSLNAAYRFKSLERFQKSSETTGVK